MSKKEKKKVNDWQTEVHLDIPEDEIWTYQVPGLAAPHINKPYKYYTLKKIVFVLVIIVAVSLSIYFSILALQNDTFQYTETEQGIEFSKFRSIIKETWPVNRLSLIKENPNDEFGVDSILSMMPGGFFIYADKLKKISEKIYESNR